MKLLSFGVKRIWFLWKKSRKEIKVKLNLKYLYMEQKTVESDPEREIKQVIRIIGFLIIH